MEESYIGAKIILAEPMDERDFAKLMGKAWEDTGPNRPGYKVRYEDGYVSWSPKGTFEKAYRKITGAEKTLVV